ncbi:MAG: alpha/beta hydrolase fold domain-containing protein [Actinobacteria bacterium]|nr:alpha/beta hydrolase fold domain-containing protein [Actinomycetota bacterium]
MRRIAALSLVLALMAAACSGDDTGGSSTTAATATDAGLELAPGTVTAGAIQVGDTTRIYLVAVPPGYDPAVPAPLLFDLHGRGGTAPGQAVVSGITALAWTYGYVVVHPQAAGDIPTWAVWPVLPEAAGEIDFFEMVLDSIESELNIDPDRVFVMGYSNGGGMAARLACDLADRITAVGVFGGSHEGWQACGPVEPVPILAIHGLADTVVPFEGGGGGTYPAIDEWAAWWADADGCTDEAEPLPLPTGTFWRWDSCAGGATVTLIGLADWGHEWPSEVHQVSTDTGMVWQGASEVFLSFFNTFAGRQ